MFQKLLLINILLSITLFLLIFFYYIGVSGGDMAILAFTVIVHILLLIINIIFFRKIKIHLKLYIVLTIILLLVVETLIFLKYGYYFNTILRK